MCAGPFDCHYAAYGGSTPRGDMINGRVGSAFNNAGLMGVPTSDFVANDPYYQDAAVPLESGETIVSEEAIIDPAAETFYENQAIISPQVESAEFIPAPNQGVENSGIIEGTIEAPLESFEGVPAMPEVQLDEGLQFPEGSSTR